MHIDDVEQIKPNVILIMDHRLPRCPGSTKYKTFNKHVQLQIWSSLFIDIDIDLILNFRNYMRIFKKGHFKLIDCPRYPGHVQ